MSQSSEDVLILGGGVIGLSCALFLLREGRSVRILDKGRVGAATSHGNCGTLTPSHAPPLAAPGMIGKALRYMAQADAPFYIKPSTDLALLEWLLRFSLRCNAKDMRHAALARAALLNASRDLLRAVIRDNAIECGFAETGELYVCRSQENLDELAADIPLLAECGVAVELLDSAAIAAREPALLPGMAGGLYFPGDAHLRPDAYCAGLARLVRAQGGVIEEECEVLSLHAEGDVIAHVETSRGRRAAPQVIAALASWSPAVLKGLDLAIPVQPGKGYSITYSRPALCPKTPLVLKERSVCVTAWDDGYRLGSTMEFSGFDDSLNARRLAALERGAREYLIEPVGAEVHEQWYGWRPMTYDDLPILGFSPRQRNLFLAAGHGMLGMSMSAITGQLAAEALTGRAPSIDLTPFSPARF
ncbi:MAG: FAD-dependent oxidoreductase [Arenimonas sp.]|nr:FAD-dependent oxidoreductase [Arenimonas sp.]